MVKARGLLMPEGEICNLQTLNNDLVSTKYKFALLWGTT